MHSSLEQEIRGRLDDLAVRVKQYDPGIVLTAALCFTPLPPTMFVGISLALFHLAVVRSKISRHETSLLYAGILVSAAYAAAWAIAIYWLTRSGELKTMLDFVTDWASWLLQNFEPSWLHRFHAPSPLLQHA